jgi:hypothetical protein
VFKDLRIKIFNWFAAGKMTLTYEKPQEYKMSSYTIAGGAGSMNYNPGLGGLTIGPSTQGPVTGKTLTIKITPATGGNIVSVAPMNQAESLYIIPDGDDFDRELGKIITMTKLKS